MAEIDTAAVSRHSGAEIGTLNVWVQRGLIPGAEVGVQGRPRTYTIDQLVHIVIVAELVSLGFSASFAHVVMEHKVLREDFENPGAKLVISCAEGPGLPPREAFHVIFATSSTELDRQLEELPGGWPKCYTTVEVGRIAADARKFVLDPDPVERARRARKAGSKRPARQKRRARDGGEER